MVARSTSPLGATRITSTSLPWKIKERPRSVEVLGDRFSMADCIFGGAVRYLLRFNVLEATPTFTAYAERLAARPAAQRADAKNAAIAKEHGLGG